MPIYEYGCPVHPEERVEVFRWVSERHDLAGRCPKCGTALILFPSLPADPMAGTRGYPYEDRAFGKVFHNKAERDEAIRNFRWGADKEYGAVEAG